MTGSRDRLVGWLLYFCPDDPVDSWEENKWPFTIMEKIPQLAMHRQPEKPIKLGQRRREVMTPDGELGG